MFWTALEETGSAVSISVLFSSIVVPVLVITVPVGLAVDRYGPRRLLLGASVAALGGHRRGRDHRRVIGLWFEAALVLGILEGVFFGVWAIPAQVLAGRLVDRNPDDERDRPVGAADRGRIHRGRAVRRVAASDRRSGAHVRRGRGALGLSVLAISACQRPPAWPPVPVEWW